VRLNDGSRDWQAEAGAIRKLIAGHTGSVKALEDPLEFLFANADAGVFNRQFNLVLEINCGDGDATRWWRVLEGIANQNQHKLACPIT
jgi:hypothetical protein